MGRNKINIHKIDNERLRQVTFYKRKKGLLKKAMELSLLCGVKVMLCVVDKNGRDVLYVSENGNPESLVKKNVIKNIKNKTYVSNQNYDDIFIKKTKKFADYSDSRRSSTGISESAINEIRSQLDENLIIDCNNKIELLNKDEKQEDIKNDTNFDLMKEKIKEKKKKKIIFKINNSNSYIPSNLKDKICENPDNISIPLKEYPIDPNSRQGYFHESILNDNIKNIQDFNDLIYNNQFKSYKDLDHLLGVKRLRNFYKEPTYESLFVNNHHLYTYSNLFINNLMLESMISKFNSTSNNKK